ncbi:hypothetical protein D9M69_672760 [compost metagenome]
MGGLGAGGHGAAFAPGRGAAVAQRQDVRIRGFQSFVDLQLAQLVQRQAQVRQQRRALDPRRPHAELGGDLAAIRGANGAAGDFRHPAGGFHADAQLGEPVGGRHRDLLG